MVCQTAKFQEKYDIVAEGDDENGDDVPSVADRGHLGNAKQN